MACGRLKIQNDRSERRKESASYHWDGEEVMLLNRVLTGLFLVLVVGPSGISQEGKLKINKKTGQLEVSPEMVEKARRQNERLRDPSFINLEIIPVSNCQDEEARKNSDCYKAHSRIKLKVLMTNMSSESITIAMNRSYYSYNIQLFRDWQLLPYRKEVVELADKPPDSVSSIRVKLEPGKVEMVDMIPLGAWYKPLEPGHYQLEIKRRFQLDGRWTNIASSSFEVEPE